MSLYHGNSGRVTIYTVCMVMHKYPWQEDLKLNYLSLFVCKQYKVGIYHPMLLRFSSDQNSNYRKTYLFFFFLFVFYFAWKRHFYTKPIKTNTKLIFSVVLFQFFPQAFMPTGEQLGVCKSHSLCGKG